MDFVDRLLGNRWQNVQPSTFFKFDNLDARVQKHLQRVYATLMAALAVCALGCYLDVAYSFGGFLTGIAGFGCLLGLAWTPSTPQSLSKRYALLAGFSFCQGASLGRLVGVATAINPALVLTAFMGTAAVFACFSLAALLSARRSYLYLGGILSSAISGLILVRLSTYLFGGAAMAFQLELYGGLIVFAGYTIFDTQMIVERAAAGRVDVVKDALDLLVDVLAVFVRLLVILMRKAEKKEQDQRRKQKRRD